MGKKGLELWCLKSYAFGDCGFGGAYSASNLGVAHAKWGFQVASPKI